MKLSKLFFPKDFNSKKLGLFVTIIFLAVELVIIIKGIPYENYIVRLTHMTLLVGLTMQVFNYEKIDDERFMAIRYFSFRYSMLILVIFALSYKSRIEPIYLAIGTLMCYSIIYYLCVFFDPEIIYKEETKENTLPWGRILVAFLAIMIAIYLLWNILEM